MISAYKLAGLVESQARMMRTYLDDPDLRVRMHPLDIAYLARERVPHTKTARIIRIAGCAVELDCAVARGNPIVEAVE